MNPPNHYHSMTDEQLAQWHQLTTQVDQLRAESEERKRALLRIQEDVSRAAARHQAEAAERSEFITQLAMKEADQRAANRRSAAALVQTQHALRALLEALSDNNAETARFHFPGEVFRAIQTCEEVLRYHGVPF